MYVSNMALVWRILPGCPAPNHNTLNAGRRRDGRPLCICPHTQVLKENRKISERSRDRSGERSRNNPRPSQSKAELDALPVLTRAVCALPENQAMVFLAQEDDRKTVTLEARVEAKKLCHSCPLQARCSTYILKNEVPAGSWGGVWGGMDAEDRKRERRRVKH